jgi:hypothetical protein
MGRRSFGSEAFERFSPVLWWSKAYPGKWYVGGDYYYGESIVGRMEPTCPQLPEFIDRARFWAGTLELQWALTGVLDNDIPMLSTHVGAARDVQLLGAPLR